MNEWEIAQKELEDMPMFFVQPSEVQRGSRAERNDYRWHEYMTSTHKLGKDTRLSPHNTVVWRKVVVVNGFECELHNSFCPTCKKSYWKTGTLFDDGERLAYVRTFIRDLYPNLTA